MLDSPPLLAAGVELVGEYEGSGYKEPHFLARRGDGQVIQLTELLFHVADACDGECTWDEIAQRVSEQYGKTVTADDVQYLVREKLRPLGILVDEHGDDPDVAKSDPLLALRFRVGVIPPGATRALARPFAALFWPPIVVAVLVGFAVMDVWFFGRHGIGAGLRELLYQPAIIVIVFGLVVVSAAFHELGHAAGCVYGGAKPGRMGAGVYLVWPAFFTDVTDAYRLGRAGRLRTDLGGVYFNAVFCLATVGLYALTGFEPLLVVIGIQHFEILHQLLPFLRLDGYYVLADATGVPDLFTRIRPIFRSLVPWRRTDDKVRELKPWVRVAVTGWVLLVVPLLLYLFATMVITAPRLIATAWDSLGGQWTKTSGAFGDGDVLGVLAGLVQMIALVLPAAGIVASLQRLARSVATGMWRWSDGSVVRRAAVTVALGAAAVFTLFSLWPNGEYRALRPGERLVVADTWRDLRQVRTGRAALTVEEAATAPPVAQGAVTPTTQQATTTTTSQPEGSTGVDTDADVVTSTTVRRQVSSSPASTTTTTTSTVPTTTTTSEQSSTTTTSEPAP